MPITYHIDTNKEVVFSIASGDVAEAEAIAHQESLRADPRFQAHFRQIVDLRKVTGVDISADAILRLAVNNPFAEGVFRAIVVVPNTVLFGALRKFDLLASDRNVNEFRIFFEMNDARRWLGLPSISDKIPPVANPPSA
jgi:hypothetical protein